MSPRVRTPEANSVSGIISTRVEVLEREPPLCMPPIAEIAGQREERIKKQSHMHERQSRQGGRRSKSDIDGGMTSASARISGSTTRNTKGKNRNALMASLSPFIGSRVRTTGIARCQCINTEEL